MKNVLVLGYSENPQRYSFLAYNLLKEKRFNPIGVNPTIKREFKTLDSAFKAFNLIYAITVYISPKNQSKEILEDIKKIKPKKVIFNPDTENDDWKKELESLNVEVVYGCSLVLLKTNQF